MPELIVGALVGIWLAAHNGVDGVGVLVVSALASLGLYFLSCQVFPYRRCWKCHGDDRAGDGRGNYRRKRACWWCKGEKDNRRIGARISGRARA